jgi:hypothetical protein
LGVLGAKWGVNIFFPNFNPKRYLLIAEPRRLSHCAQISGQRSSRELVERSKKKKNRQHPNTSRICRDPPTEPIETQLGMWGPVPDVINRAKSHLLKFSSLPAAATRKRHIRPSSELTLTTSGAIAHAVMCGSEL